MVDVCSRMECVWIVGFGKSWFSFAFGYNEFSHVTQCIVVSLNVFAAALRIVLC